MRVVSLTSQKGGKNIPPLNVKVDQFRGSDADLAATRQTHNQIKNSRGRTERLFNMRMNIARKTPTANANPAATNANTAANANASSRRRRGRSGGPSGGRNSDARTWNEQNAPQDYNGQSHQGMANYDKYASTRQRSSTDFSDYDRSPSPPNTTTAHKFGPKSVFSKATFKSLPSLRGKSQQQTEMARRNRPSQSRSRSRSPSGNRSISKNKKENRRQHQSRGETEFKAHPWILPPYLRLAPRVDAWFAFAVVSCAAVSSIGQIKSTTTNSSGAAAAYGLTFTSGDDYALSICAISFIVAFGIAAGMRYAPMRTALTKNIFPNNNNSDSNCVTSLLAPLKLTAELIVLSIMALLWIIAMPIIVNGNAHYSANKDVPLAMAGTDIWNANLYYSSWASFLLCAYLWVEVFTLTDRRGTLKVNVAGPYPLSSRLHQDNVFAKRWSLLVLTSVILMSASIVTYTSPSCKGILLKQTSYCNRALLGILLGGLFQFLIGFGVVALFRLSQMSTQLPRSRDALAPPAGIAVLSEHTRNLGTSSLAVLSLIVQTVNAGLLTSPTGGGPGNISGTLYFGSWLGFALALEMCIRYLELFTTSVVRSGGSGIGGGGGSSWSTAMSRGGRSTATDTPTVYEDDDNEDEESLTMRRALTDGGSVEDSESEVDTQQSAAGTQMSDGQMNDAQSFVFSYSVKQQPAATPLLRLRRKQDDPSAENGHYRRGVDPEEDSRDRKARSMSGGSSGSRSRGRRSPSEPDINKRSDPSMVGSIDARSLRESRSGDERSRNNDPDGEVDRYYDTSGNVATVDESSEGSFFDFTQKSRSFDNTRRTKAEPPSITSFHMDQVEKLDEIPSSHSSSRVPGTQQQQQQMQPEPAPSAAQIAQLANQLRAQGQDQPLRRQSTGTNLSPLQEGQEEISPTTGSDTGTNSDGSASTENGPPTIDGESADVHAQQTLQQQQQQQQREVGANLRTMQAMRGVMNSMPVHQADRSKKSGSGSSKMSSVGASTRSGSRSGSRKKGRRSGSSGHSSGRQASRHSRQSRQSTASRRTTSSYASMRSGSGESAILTDHSEQGDSAGQHGRRFNQLSAHSKPSAKSMRSASTFSSHVSTASAIMTDDEESGSNPPPTISDGISSNGNLSGFYSSSSSSKRSGSPKGNQGPPRGLPPPPFRRAAPDRQHDYGDAKSQHSGSVPVRSIQTRKGSLDSDTIVSDPTLDAGLDQSPKQNYSSDSQRSHKRKVAPPPPRQKTPDGPVQRHSSSTTDSYNKKYSDETDHKSSLSDENPSSQEGEGGEVVDNIVQAALAYAEKTHSASDPLAFANRGTGTTGTSLQPPLGQHKSISMPHQPSVQKKYLQSSSSYSFFTESDTQDDEGEQQSLYETQSRDSAPVEDLVSQALNHAQGQLDGKPPPNYSNPLQQQHHRTSEYSWVSGKSVGSMYSQDDTEISHQGEGVHYDC